MADLTRKTANLLNNSNFEQGGWDATTGTIPFKNSNSKRCRYSDFFSISSTIIYYDFKDLNVNIIMVDSNGISLGGSGFKTGIGSFAVLNNTDKISLIIANTDTTQDITPEEVQSKNISLDYGWVHSLRKLGTATEDIENPLYSDGTAITAYTIKGNTVQSGTPTPSNPITISGVGNKTANLLNTSMSNAFFYSNYPSSSYGNFTISNNTITLDGSKIALFALPTRCDAETTYYFKANISGGTQRVRIRLYSEMPVNRDDNYISMPIDDAFYGTVAISFTTTSDTKYALVEFYHADNQTERVVTNLMISTIDTSYEPYGYKIPISSGGVTTNLYTTEPLMKIGDTVDSLVSSGTATYATKVLELTGNENWLDDNLQKGDTFLYHFRIDDIVDIGQTVGDDMLCTHFVIGNIYNTSVVGFQHTGKNIYFRTTETTLANFQQWLADEKAAGRSVTLYYILATPTTETVTAPSIPTTEGANSITVDTTVQPSEFTATWTGWHDSSVKEYTEGANLSPITAFTNTTTDSRQFIRPRIQTNLNGAQQQFVVLNDISTTGTVSYTVTINMDNDYLIFKHGGAQTDIQIFVINGGVPQGTYTLSFSVEGYDCSVVGGMIISNIEFVDNNGGHWE